MKKCFLAFAAALILLACNHETKVETAFPVRFVPLDLGSVRPEGWLLDWANTAAEGITGHLDEYEAVIKYGWCGKDIDAKQQDGVKLSSTGWLLEQSAYWLDGALKLGYMLDNEVLLSKTTSRLDSVVEGVLANDCHTFIYWKPDSIVVVENGSESKGAFNNWANGLMGRCLVSYYQASHDSRILQALEKVYSKYYLKRPQDDIYGPDAGMINGMVRGATNLDAMSETYLLTGNKAIRDTMLAYAADPYQKDQEKRLLAKKGRWDNNWGDATIHGVTFYETARIPALLALWTGDREELEASLHTLEWGERFNGLPYGVSSAEEYLSGIGSNRHTETCDITAAMWTRTWMLRITGDASWGDQVEAAFLNAGPVPVARDFRTMSYYQCPNRLSINVPGAPPIPGPGKRVEYTPNGNSTLCCVSSCNWIIPNYVQNMWMATTDGGLAFTLYGPCSVEAGALRLKCSTDYPFGDVIKIEVDAVKSECLPLYFRLPGWCSNMGLKVNGEEQKLDICDGFAKLERRWKSGDSIEIMLPMEVSIQSGEDNIFPRFSYFTEPQWGRYNKAVDDTVAANPYACVYYGPLLYSLPLKDIDENTVEPGQLYGYAIAEKDPSKVEIVKKEMPGHWDWGLFDAPVELRLKALYTGWEPAVTQPLPHSRSTQGSPAEITLVPYNCTKFRVSMFPVAFE